MTDSMATLRAARELGDSMSEQRRQRIGRIAFARAMGEEHLLVRCKGCGLKADYRSPCTECERYRR